MRYEERRPPAELREVVEAVWVVAGTVGEAMRVVPDARADLIALDHGVDRLLLNGPMPGAETIRLWQPVTYGLRFRLGTLPRLGGLESLAAIRGGALAVAGPADAGEPEEQLLRLARRMLAQGRLVRHVQVDRALHALLGHGGGATPGLGTRQLQRLFAVHVGLPPRAVFAAVRHDGLARQLRRGRGPSLAALAADLRFADQAHLTNAFTRLAGVPPGQYRREVAQDVFVQDATPSAAAR